MWSKLLPCLIVRRLPSSCWLCGDLDRLLSLNYNRSALRPGAVVGYSLRTVMNLLHVRAASCFLFNCEENSWLAFRLGQVQHADVSVCALSTADKRMSTMSSCEVSVLIQNATMRSRILTRRPSRCTARYARSWALPCGAP